MSTRSDDNGHNPHFDIAPKPRLKSIIIMNSPCHYGHGSMCIRLGGIFYTLCISFHFILSCHFGYLLLIVVDMLLFGQPNHVLSRGSLREFSILPGVDRV